MTDETLAVTPNQVAVRVAALTQQVAHLEGSLADHKTTSAASHGELKADLKEIKDLVTAAIADGAATKSRVQQYETFGKWGLRVVGGCGVIVAWLFDLIPSARQALESFLNLKG